MRIMDALNSDVISAYFKTILSFKILQYKKEVQEMLEFAESYMRKVRTSNQDNGTPTEQDNGAVTEQENLAPDNTPNDE